jgi:hypothetical protein
MFEWYIGQRTDKPQGRKFRLPPHGAVKVVAVLVFGAAHVVSRWTGLPLPFAVVAVIAVPVVTVVLVVRKYIK